VGAGAETSLSNHVSVKAEYLFENFNTTNASAMNHNITANQTFSNSVKMKSNILKLGINYRFDDQGTGAQFTSLLLPELLTPDQWETEMGARFFVSTGIDGTPQPLFNSSPIGNILASRLIFSDLQAISGETFARADNSSGFFMKGYLGAGTMTNGQLNDEDFPAGGAYSNTLSTIENSNLSYATADLGFSFLKTLMGKVGAFVGYNYYAQNLRIYDCQQVAGAAICGNSSEFSNFLGISQEDSFNSLRVGLSSQFNLTDRLTLTSEVAYLPLVGYSGEDLHNARQLVLPEQASDGDGVMLESTLNYQFDNSWSLGLGGRYWIWNMHSGSTNFNPLGIPETATAPARYNTERYGAFLQLSYRDNKPNPMDRCSAPMDWKGFFVGGNLGGAWGKNDWSDPFGPTPGDPGFINVAGFGDNIRSSGPLGGANLNFNWQTRQWVYGIGANINIADIRGDGTLFSGLGGVNGQMVANYFGTIVGRVGKVFNHSLFYVNGGAAMLNTEYTVLGNTTALELGSESQTNTTWGWTGGFGVEHALTDHWTSNVEYDYIHIPSHVSFPSLNVISGNRFSVDQNMNVFKVGINYKI